MPSPRLERYAAKARKDRESARTPGGMGASCDLRLRVVQRTSNEAATAPMLSCPREYFAYFDSCALVSKGNRWYL
jgi:hypothetical protein